MSHNYLKGFIVSFAFAIPAYYLGQAYPLIGGPVFGILLGLLFSGVKLPRSYDDGIRYTGKKVLQYAIILLGFEMNLFHVLDVGAQSLLVMFCTLATSFLTAWGLGRLLGMSSSMTTLIGAGTGICGGSAIAAVAPVIDARDKDIAFSISTIFLFNIIAVFLFPFIGHLLNFSDYGFGMWAGTAINDTSSVVAAGYSYSAEAGGYATIVKLTRALMIVPVCLFFAFLTSRRKAQEGDFHLVKVFPWFILWFVVASIVNTSGLLPVQLTSFLGSAGKFAIILAMSAIGLHTDIRGLIHNGLRPILLGLGCWIAVASMSLFIQHLIGFM